MESAPLAKPETPKEKKIENKEKTISLSIDKKIFTVEFKNEIEYLSIVASYQESLFLVKYKGKFTLSDIKKVGLFRDYESIDECLFEIFEGLNSEPTLTEKDNLNIIITVPLHTRKYPEITFTLKKLEKNESQKYDELVNVLLNMKNEKDKEIKELKDKVENLKNCWTLKIKKKKIRKKLKNNMMELKQKYLIQVRMNILIIFQTKINIMKIVGQLLSLLLLNVMKKIFKRWLIHLINIKMILKKYWILMIMVKKQPISI